MKYWVWWTEIGNSRSFFALLPTKSLKPQNLYKIKKNCWSSFYTCVPKITIIWCMVCEIQSEINRFFCHFGPFFALSLPANVKNHNFEEMKRAPGDVIIVHMSINTYNHMYASWDMERDRIFCHFGPFCHFIPITTWKMKTLKKWKKLPGNIIILQKYT